MLDTSIDTCSVSLEISSAITTPIITGSFEPNNLLINFPNNSNLGKEQSISNEIYSFYDYIGIANDDISHRQCAYKDDDLLSLVASEVYRNLNHSVQVDALSQTIDEITGQVLADDNSEFEYQIPLSFLANDGNTTQANYFATATPTNELSAEKLSTSQSLTLQSKTFSKVSGYGLVNAPVAVAGAIGKSPFADVSNVGGYNWGLDTIQAPEVWAKGYTGKNVVVAVLDSGVDYTHADLNDNIWRNRGEIFGNGIDDDRNGYVDDVIGWNFVGNNNNPMDYEGHGTHVAGIIAAERNEFGTTGVAYNSQIMPIKVVDEKGSGTQKNIAQGIVYAANNGADVINLSLGGGYSSEIEQAIRYATQRGATVVMAAGNEGAGTPIYPAALATDWGIAVGAIDQYRYMANLSNRAGSDSRLNYVVAPGVNIYSTIPGNKYGYLNGTSMATPYVSGVAALMLSANPTLTPNQVRQIIVQSSLA
ncbi:S8 family peptidase [Scytonema sp. PCC 10023]|uniref:S8 family peptidase n=1 Tax=Scytonema sp. PCC 10023 TaxID=1680591 RepID=UPI0039C68BB8